MPSNKSVAIIGAGANGIIALYECLQLNLDVTVYEKDSNFGGVWNIHSEFSQSHKATIFNTTVLLGSYDVEDCLAKYYDKNYMNSDEFYDYLNNFVRKHDLMRYIKFNCEILNIEKNDDAHFMLHTKSEVYCHEFVMVVTGRFGKEIIPRQFGINWADHKFYCAPFFHTRYWDVYRDKNADINELMNRDELRILVIGGSHSSSEAIQDIVSKYHEEDDQRILKIYWQPTRHLNDKAVWLVDRYPYKGRKKALPIDQSGCRFLTIFKWAIGLIIKSIAIPLYVPKGRYLYKPGYDHICICKTDIVKPYLDNGNIEILTEPIKLEFNKEIQHPNKGDDSLETSALSNVEFKKMVSGEIIKVDCVLFATGYEYAEPTVTIKRATSHNEVVSKKLVSEGGMFRNIIPTQPELNYKLGYLCTTKIFGSSLPTTQMEVRWLLYHWFMNPTDFFKDKIPKFTNSLKSSTPVNVNERFSEQYEIYESLAKDIPGCLPNPYLSLLSLWPSTRKMGLAQLLGPWIIHHYNWCNTPDTVARRRRFILESTEAIFNCSNSIVSFETICIGWGLSYMIGLAIGVTTLVKFGRNWSTNNLSLS